MTAERVIGAPVAAPLPPGRSGLPLLGETPAFLGDPAAFVAERAQRHGAVFRTHLFGKPTAVLLGADANRFVLADGMAQLRWKDGWPPNFRALLGDALFLQDGPEHLRKRKLLMPAFHGEAVGSYIATMEERLREAVARWERLGRFAWYDEFHRLTFEVSSKLFLGTDLSDGERLNRLIDDWTRGLLAVPLPLPFTAYGRALRVRRELLEYVDRAIERREREPAKDALGLLVACRDESGAALGRDELKSQALFLVAAGYATTTSMLTYAAYALATHPDVLERARAEQREIGGGPSLRLEDVARMTYLDRVVLEVERRYPPVGFGFRGVAEPFVFRGYAVPSGWQVLFSIDATHADPTLFQDPERFDPDRFAAGGAAERSGFKLVGFGGGPRVCMGLTLARTQVKVVLAHLLRDHAWEIEPGQDLRARMMPARRPRDGLRVRLRRLERPRTRIAPENEPGTPH